MRRFIHIILLWLITSTIYLPPALACTLWAANGASVEGSGTLIIKNRDWVPNHRQELKFVIPQNGYRYIGLFAANGNYAGLKSGLNEKGLVAVSASASSIPMRERKQMPGTHKLLNKLLINYGSVDEALQDVSLFRGPRFIMLADKTKVAYIEVGPAGSVSVRVEENGILFHTNHYVDEQMSQYNKKVGESSQVRYERIGELLKNTDHPYDLDTFISFSHDQNDGDDNSIFRVGSTPKKARTLSVWAVSLPASQPPELYVEIMNPGESRQTFRLKPFLPDSTFNRISGIPAVGEL